MTLEDLEKRIQVIEKRNQKVALDKKWETSWTRRFGIALLTYLTMGIYMGFIGSENAWVSAVIPTTGFLLSTLTLTALRTWWSSKQP